MTLCIMGGYNQKIIIIIKNCYKNKKRKIIYTLREDEYENNKGS